MATQREAAIVWGPPHRGYPEKASEQWSQWDFASLNERMSEPLINARCSDPVAPALQRVGL